MDWVQWWAVAAAALIVITSLVDDVKKGSLLRLGLSLFLLPLIYLPVFGRVWHWW